MKFVYRHAGQGGKSAASLALTVFAVAYASQGWWVVDTLAYLAAEALSGY